MTLLFWLLNIAIIIALGALVMTIWNLRLYRPAPAHAPSERANDLISVCIPARNEQDNLQACVDSILANDHIAIEVLVYDDHSTDQTPAILEQLCKGDSPVRRVPTQPLPDGWNGKQFGCDQMGRAARGTWLLFTDADVRFAPDALRRSLAAASSLKADLVSTFPRQRTGTLSEMLMLPMIAFILFSYLPMIRMRRTSDPSASAGCGQFLFVKRESWLHCGGHSAFANSMHDGIKLPRLLRQNGFHTDLFDGTALAQVRMYEGLQATWRGFAKNAYEGLGSAVLLMFLTTLHALGHIFPWIVAVVAMVTGALTMPILILCCVAIGLNITQRVLLARRFQHSRLLALVHPISVLMMVLVQWHSAYLHLCGKRSWRGRQWQPEPAETAVEQR